MRRTDDNSRSRRIGYLTANLADPFQRELLTHAQRAAHQLGVEIVAAAGGTLLTEARSGGSAYDVMRRAEFDGILLCANTVCHGMLTEQIAEFACSFAPAPVVIVGAAIPGHCCHTVNNETGAAVLAEHLITVHNRERFAAVRGPLDHDEADARLRGVRNALRRHDLELPEDRIVVGDFSEASGRAAAEQLLERDPGLRNTDAVVFANDLMAMAALDVFARARIPIPGAVSLVGFDDVEIAHLARAPLSTVRQPLAQQVSSALADLIHALDGNEISGLVQHPTRLVLRRSCGCGLVTAERLSSIPAPPPGGGDPLDTLGERGPAVAADLGLAIANSSLPRALSDDWAANLVDSFLDRIREHDQAFIDRIDALACALIQQDEPLTPLRDAVLWLRRQLSVLTGSTGAVADDLDDATAEALLAIGSVEALREAQRRREFEAVALELMRTTASLAASANMTELSELAYTELARLNIKTCVPAMLDSAEADAAPRIPFACVGGETEFRMPSVAPGQLALPAGVVPQLLLVPMVSQGEMLGYVLYDLVPEAAFLRTGLTLALGAALGSAVLKERLETAYVQIAEQALRDSLTGLWNRRYLAGRLREEIARAQRSGTALSACVIDLDGFKTVNDLHGHEAGDRVLTMVARRLEDIVRANDVIARLGGDEFVVILAGAEAPEAVAAAERVVGRLKRADEYELVTASVGVATVTPAVAGGDSGGQVLREADAALLVAKRRGKCRAIHFDQIQADSR